MKLIVKCQCEKCGAFFDTKYTENIKTAQDDLLLYFFTSEEACVFCGEKITTFKIISAKKED